jgi:hypothetical protein
MEDVSKDKEDAGEDGGAEFTLRGEDVGVEPRVGLGWLV